MRTLIITLCTVFALGLAASPAFSATQLENLENALMCQCDDNCGKVLINCNCDYSDEMRATLTKKLESGLTVDQIIKGYVDEYGETVLSAPTKKGFNLTAWVTPFVALVIGGLGIRRVVVAWTRKSQGNDDEDAPPASGNDEESPSNTEDRPYKNRLKDELDRLET